MDPHNQRFYMSRKLVWTVTSFIVIASLLVVLTNLSINLVSASHTYSEILSRWGQLHYKSDVALQEFRYTGDERAYTTYRQIHESRDRLQVPIDALFHEDMDARTIFESLQEEGVSPNEISTLVTVFRYYSNWRVIRDMNSEWDQLKQLEREQHQHVERIYREGPTVRDSVDTAGFDKGLFVRRMGQWERQYHELMMYVTSASLVVKRFSLWISVILGVLLVLIGVVVSVRANKSMKIWEKVLNEQQILLYEIHHRVKNNLAVISGFFELESMQNEDPEKALQDSRYRIRTMAMIHETLYQSHTFSEVRMDQYLEKLSTEICTSRIEQCSDIPVTTDLEVVTLNINQAVPAGLLINEFLSLVIEQGAASIKQSGVLVTLREKAGRIVISCSVHALEHLTKQSLGKSSTVRHAILNALLMQLDADLQIRHTERTVLEVQFEKVNRSGSSSRYI